MKTLLKCMIAVAAAVVASFLCLLIFTFLGTQTSRSRIEKVVRIAGEHDQIEWMSNFNNDFFTECSMLESDLLRDSNVMRDIASSKLSATPGHPCEIAGLILIGQAKESRTQFRYFYGARHLAAILARFTSLAGMRILLGLLGIAAPLLLGVAFLFRARESLLAMSPIILVLIAGFDLGNLGFNIAHAPGFVFPLLMLAGVVWYRDYFTPLPRRFAAFAAIAATTTYFDNLNGPLPFILAVSLIVNHFAFNSKRPDISWLQQSAGLCVVFVFTVVTIVGLKLELASLFFGPTPFGEFRFALAHRMSTLDDGAMPITRMQVVTQLWGSRALPFFGSSAAATFFHAAGGLAWIAAVLMLVLRRGRHYREVLVLSCSTAIIALWYMVFVNHTYIHHQFMGRIGVLPATAGLIAFIVVAEGNLAVLALAVVPLAGLLALLQTQFFSTRIIEVRRDPHVSVDVASCSNELLLRPDGKPDVVWRARFAGSSWTDTRMTGLKISRTNPFGMVSTGPVYFPVAVLSADGKLLSGPDRRIDVSISGRKELLLAECDDGADTPQSHYGITATTSDGDISAVPVR